MSEFDDRAMILDEKRWPGEILCLKKRHRANFDLSNFAIITNSRFPLDLYSHEGAFIKQYSSIDELLKDDWIVD